MACQVKKENERIFLQTLMKIKFIKKKKMSNKKSEGSAKKIWTIGISLVLMLIINNTYGQKCKGVEVINDEGKDIVRQAEEINWYGLDLSMASLTNGKKSKDGELIRDTYCPAWITYFNVSSG